MPVYKYLARQHEFDVSDSASLVGATWTPISGLNSWGWAEDTNDADVSDFDNAGWNSSFAVSKSATLTLEGWYLVDAVTGARDSGQYIAEIAARKLGPTGFRYFRVRARNDADSADIGSITIQGSVKLTGDFGGGQDDVMKWGVEVMAQGKPTGSGIYSVFS